MGMMRSDIDDMYWWLFGGSGTILFPWERIFSSRPNINDTLVISSKPSVMRTDIALVDLTTNSTAGLARSQDAVHFAENGEFNIAFRNVEYVTAAHDKVVDFFQIDHFGFTTDGSIRTLEANVGNHLVSFETAARDSFIFLGDGIDQVVLGDDPDVFIVGDPNINYPTYWAVKRDFDNSVIAYALSTGNKVELRGGDAASKATLPGGNYGEIEILTHSNFRGGPDTDLYLGKGGIKDPYKRSGFENIDLNTYNLEDPIDTFLHASFGSINFSSRNVFVGAAVVEEWNGTEETAERQSEAYRFSTTSTAAVDHNHDLMVAEQATALDGHLRLYVRDEDSRLYNRFNEVYLGSASNDVNANTGATTSRNGTNEKIFHTAMYGFGGNDILTAGIGDDYLFGGESSYTSFVGGPIGNIVTGGDGDDYFGVGNIGGGATGDAIFSSYDGSRLAGAAPVDDAGSLTDVGQLYRTGVEETADLSTRVATDRIQDWTAGVDSLRVLANGTAIIEGLGTENGAVVEGYDKDPIGSDAERIDVSGDKVLNEGKIVLRGLGGNDTIIGSGGDDWFYGNSGDNLIVAGAAVSGTDGSSDGTDRIHYDTYAGRTFASGFDAGDKVYLNKQVLDAITGNFSRATEVANNLTSSATSLSGTQLTGTQTYTAAVAYDPTINFLHDVFYGPSGALPSNQQHVDGSGFVDGSDSYADISTGLIGAGMFAAGLALNVFLPGAGKLLMSSGIALGGTAGASAVLEWTTPHQHATYTGDISGNYLSVLTAQNYVNSTVAIDGNANVDNKSFLDFFASSDAGDGYTPAIQFTSLDANQAINQFMVVHSDEETFIYWVYSRDAIVTAGEAIKIAEINGILFAEDFAIYDGSLDVYNFGTLEPIIIYTPSITSVGYNVDKAGNLGDAGDVAVIAQDAAVVLPGGGRFEIEGQFFKAIGELENPFTTSEASAIVSVAYSGHGLSDGDWVQISGASAANGIDFNGTYRVANVTSDTFTFIANKFTESAGVSAVSSGAANVSATFAEAGTIRDGSTIRVYDGVDRLDADPLTAEDDVSIVVSGDSFTLYDERALGTSLRQAPDGVVTESGDSYVDADGNSAFFKTTVDSATVSVTYSGHGLVVGDSITIATATSAAFMDFNGTWVVSSTPSPSEFTFVVGDLATASEVVNTSFSFTKVSAPVVVPQADISAEAGTLTVTMTDHGMLTGDRITFTTSFNAGGKLFSAGTAYVVTRVNDGQFTITSTVDPTAGDAIPDNVTFSVPNGGDQTFFLKDEKVSYYVEVTNADSGFETMSLQYNFTVGGGNTTLNGGRGDDMLVISDESASLNGLLDAQIVNLESIQITNDEGGSLTLDLSQQTDGFTIYDSGAGNSIIGSQGDDEIYGFGGADTLTGGDGDDTINGGDSADLINAGAGADVIVFASAAELEQDATVIGGAGSDTIRMDSAAVGLVLADADFADVIEVENLDLTGTGTQAVTLDTETNQAFATGITLTTNAAATSLNLQGASSTVSVNATGTGNADTLVGGSAGDTLVGGNGNDTIMGGGGADTLDGGAGADVFLIAAAAHHASGEIITGGSGADTIRFTSLTAGETLNLLVGVTDVDGVMTVEISDADGGNTGTTALNVNADALVDSLAVNLIGNDGDNILVGNATGDTILGGAGNDTITGGAGADTLTGGAGNDVYVYTGTADVAAAETITEGVGGGTDRLRVDGTTNFSVMAAANFDEIEELAITGAFTATFLGAQLTGETMSLIGDTGSTQALVVTATAGATTDLSNISAGANWTAGTDTVTINGANGSNEVIVGTQTADVINGGTGDDTIIGGAGSDNLSGGAGSDVFVIASASDHASGETITGGSETDVIRFASTAGATLVLSASVDVDEVRIAAADGTASGTTAESINAASAVGGIALYGNEGANSLIGNASNNVISGGGGNDTITGGAGADQINAGSGTNSVTDAGNGADTIVHNSAASTVAIAVTGASTVTLTASEAGATATVSAGISATIDASNSTASVTVIGSSSDNIITGGKTGDTIAVGSGGNDKVVYKIGANNLITNGPGLDVDSGYDIITNFQEGGGTRDVFIFDGFKLGAGRLLNGSEATTAVAGLGADAAISSTASILKVNGAGVAAGAAVQDRIAGVIDDAFNLGSLDSPEEMIFVVESDTPGTWWVGIFQNTVVDDGNAGSEIQIAALVSGGVNPDWDNFRNTLLTIGGNPNTSNLSFYHAESTDGLFDDKPPASYYGPRRGAQAGDQVLGLTPLEFEPGVTQIPVPSDLNGVGDDVVDGNQYEVYYGDYDPATNVFTVRSTPGTIATTASGFLSSTHTMILYDNDTTATNTFWIEGVVFEGVFAENQWALSGTGASRVLEYNPLAATAIESALYGTAGSDVISGGNGPDFIFGEGGDDDINAGDGGAYIEGGDGNDTIIWSGSSPATVYGGGGNDNIDPGADESGDTLIFGEAGNDTIYGGGGNDTIHGGSESDWIFGEIGNDVIFGGAGADQLYGGQQLGIIPNATGDGSGSDIFAFSSSSESAASVAADTIRTFDLMGDFVSGSDKIQLDLVGAIDFLPTAAAANPTAITFANMNTFSDLAIAIGTSLTASTSSLAQIYGVTLTSGILRDSGFTTLVFVNDGDNSLTANDLMIHWSGSSSGTIVSGDFQFV